MQSISHGLQRSCPLAQTRMLKRRRQSRELMTWASCYEVIALLLTRMRVVCLFLISNNAAHMYCL